MLTVLANSEVTVIKNTQLLQNSLSSLSIMIVLGEIAVQIYDFLLGKISSTFGLFVSQVLTYIFELPKS